MMSVYLGCCPSFAFRIYWPVQARGAEILVLFLVKEAHGGQGHS